MLLVRAGMVGEAVLVLVAGYLAVWAARKAGRVAKRADAEVDRALEASLDKLHDLVSRMLGEDPALTQLAREAAAGQDELTPRTQQRVQLALEEASEQNPDFAAAVAAAVAAVQEAEKQAGPYSVDARGAAGVQVGDNTMHADTVYGVMTGTAESPITINYGDLPGPPAPPGTN